MWDIVYKFFEYAPLYIGLVLVPALIRTFFDTAVIKIPASSFQLPPSEREVLNVKYEDAFSSIVSTAFYAPLVEELVYRAVPYLLLGMPGLIIGNVVWVLAHPSWQLRYVTGLPTWKKVAFTINSAFYYSCAAVFYTLPWLEGYGILSIIYHMFHNGVLTIGGIFSEIEFPAPWKKDEAEFFRESRGLKRKLEERFFRDTNPPEEEDLEEELELDVDLNSNKFFREIEKATRTEKVEKPKARKEKVSRVVAKVNEDLWSFWVK